MSFAASEDICIDGEILPTSNLKAFSFGELKSATGNFRNSTVLGQGGFGTVYKGFVDEKTLAPTKFGSGTIVAIKKLNPESIQGFQEWQVINSFELITPKKKKLFSVSCFLDSICKGPGVL